MCKGGIHTDIDLCVTRHGKCHAWPHNISKRLRIGVLQPGSAIKDGRQTAKINPESLYTLHRLYAANRVRQKNQISLSSAMAGVQALQGFIFKAATAMAQINACPDATCGNDTTSFPPVICTFSSFFRARSCPASFRMSRLCSTTRSFTATSNKRPPAPPQLIQGSLKYNSSR